MNNFFEQISDACKSDVDSYLDFFVKNKKGVVIVGYNKYGEMWANRLIKLGIQVIGFCEYKATSLLENTFTFDEILSGKWNVCICSIDIDIQSKIASILSKNNINYIDLTYVVNNWYVNHYDKNLIWKNIDKIYKVYSLLSDKASKEVYLSLIKYRITRNPSCLLIANYPQYFHPLIRPKYHDNIIEAGGFDGETALETAKFLKFTGQIFSFEPEPSMFNHFEHKIKEHNIKCITPIKLGLWNETGILKLHSDGAASNISANGENEISVITLDSFVTENSIHVDLLKLDVEGAEKQVIEGARKTILLFQPKLQISVYHKATDLWDLVLQIHEINPYYRFYIGHHTKFVFDTVVYAIM